MVCFLPRPVIVNNANLCPTHLGSRDVLLGPSRAWAQLAVVIWTLHPNAQLRRSNSWIPPSGEGEAKIHALYKPVNRNPFQSPLVSVHSNLQVQF